MQPQDHKAVQTATAMAIALMIPVGPVGAKHFIPGDKAMNYTKNGVENLKIAYIGGGSRGWAWTLMSDLATADDLRISTTRLQNATKL